MMAECIMKKTKAIMGVQNQGGVMTRSRIRALHQNKNDGSQFMQLGGSSSSCRRVDKLGVGSGVVKKKQRKGGSLGKGKGKEKKVKERKVKVEVEEEKVENVEKGGLEDVGGVDFVECFDLDEIGGGEGLDVGGVGVNGDGDGLIDGGGGDDDMMIGGDIEYGGVVGDEIGGVDGIAANADGVDEEVVAGGDDDAIVGGGDDVASGGVAAAAEEGGVDGTAAISGGDGGEGAELGGDFAGGNDRVIRESTPEHLIIRSDYITTPCSGMKGANAVADERPQTEVGGDSHQHMKLTTDLRLQDNSNYAPSMEKYNFDFENEKPLFGRYEWEKVQP